MPDEDQVANDVKQIFDEKAPAILWHCVPKEDTILIRGEFFFAGPRKDHMVHAEIGIPAGVDLSEEALQFIMERFVLELAKALLEWRP